MKSLFFSSISCLLLGVLISCSNPTEPKADSKKTEARQAAPDFEFRDLDDKLVNSQTFHGKWVVLNVWATWCPPCVREIPDFIALQNELKKKNVQFIGISVDEGGAADVKPFAQKVNFNYPVLLANMESLEKLFGAIDAIPTTFIIDPQWRIASRNTGSLSKEELNDEVQRAMKEK
ncbi:MAG: TlpA disulfide reductase family protein [bacterium]